ncbi:odorant receptor 67d-like isoform X1 [Musca domestica]|uniref:Odorant receptor n=1 Tax=Musca domestica TaxID=7370 RepID=A0A1I8MGW0_MUSDO|nr:odorant receptor 67d-like isoform X1 [Musca domestica]
MAGNIQLSPSERFAKFIKVIKLFAGFCGVNSLERDYRVTWVTWLVICVVTSFFVCTFYTIYVGMAIQNNYSILLQSLCITGTGVQGYTKLLNAIFCGKHLRFAFEELTAIYEEYECKRLEYRDNLKENLEMVKRLIYGLLLINFILIAALFAVPLFYYYVRKEKIDVIPLMIPGINPSNNRIENYIYQFYHICCVIFSTFGNFASDTFMILIVVHVPMIKNIFKLKFDDMAETMKLHLRNRKKTEPLLRDIFQWHQKTILIIETMQKGFFWVIFVQIFTSMLNIIFTIVCIFLGVWPVAPVYLLYSFVILYIYCGIGNLVEISTDDITSIIYDFIWYDLTVSEQKMILIMLRESQSPPTMTIGGVMPLSMNTALQLTKSIYTIAMLLNEFVN